MPTLITTQGSKMLLKAHFGGEIGLIWGKFRFRQAATLRPSWARKFGVSFGE